MIDLNSYEIFSESRQSLKETSKDDSNSQDIQYMTTSEMEVINFDLVKRKYANALDLSEESATSVDAILPFRDGIIFLEFKNGIVNNRNIKDKARDSLLIFLGIIKKSIEYSRRYIDFVVVYNAEKNPVSSQKKERRLQETPSRVSIATCLMNKAGEEFIRFDLERYKTLYYRNIHTYTKDNFDRYLLSLEAE